MQRQLSRLQGQEPGPAFRSTAEAEVELVRPAEAMASCRSVSVISAAASPGNGAHGRVGFRSSSAVGQRRRRSSSPSKRGLNHDSSSAASDVFSSAASDV